MSELTIKKLSPDDVINDFWNRNLRDYISSRSDMLLFGAMDPDARVGIQQGPPIGNNNVPTTIDVKAKQAVKNAEATAKMKLEVLVCLEKLREEMKDFNV